LQNKPNSNPIAKRPKMNVSDYYTKIYNNKTAVRRSINKTNSQLSLIDNQLINDTVEVVSLLCKIDDYGKILKLSCRKYSIKADSKWYHQLQDVNL
jgi:hypothetical protein